MIVRAKQEQTEEIMFLLEQAKKRMHAAGIPQWDASYPDRLQIQRDILQETAYVYMRKEKIVGYFVLAFVAEASYANIRHGQWRNENPYGVIHRLAFGDGMGHGLAQEVFSFAEKEAVCRGIHDLRVDTHAKNIPMQRALQKAGFQYCGIIILDNGEIRNAYQAEFACA